MKEKRECQGSGLRDILLFQGQSLAAGEARIIGEIPLTIHLNERKVVTIACAGLHVEELAVGFLRSEGLIRSRAEIAGVEVHPDCRQVRVHTVKGREERLFGGAAEQVLTSSGARLAGAGRALAGEALESAMILTPREILCLMERFLALAGLHEETGGTHAAALARDGKILVVREDIGRHNTIDMLGGHALLNGLDCRQMVLCRTGRVSSEIVQKIRLLGIPVAVSLSVPTTLAVDMARAAGITLVGSVRGGRMKIYSQEGRVKI
ncbi:MAG: formate dehydrogenase accessory sulfurtransferase FdhD [Deltaproteobacteria bacterium]|nr:formate dehydrogenase accessory sulfurtransferase FdhD [Deltaproteobacteria bacterium]